MQDQQSGGGRGKPQALERYRGQAKQPRYRGVYHYHRHMGWNPHPQRQAARRLLNAPPRSAGPTHAGTVHAPLHQHQHAVSARHAPGPRRAGQLLEVGLISAYDAPSGTAMVQLLGSPTRLVGPIPVTACAPRDLTLVGAACLVVLLDEHNPQDGVVAAVWSPAGGSLGAKLTQAGVAAIGVANASQASITASFPTAHAGAPAVVATATDPAWTATISSITATGFALTIHAAAPATGTVTVEWLACG